MTSPKTAGNAPGRRAVLAGAAAASTLAFPAIHARAQAAGGVALVIGNSKYQWEAPLPNVRRDAPDVAKQFQAMGLKTELVQDVGRDAMRQAVEKFATSARGASFAAFYFAGHGAAWGNDTYLVPVDADLTTPKVVETLLPVAAVGAALDGAANRLAVFDNCRNNPADGWRQVQAQRAAIVGSGSRAAPTGGPNALTLYSTAAGRVALDGPPGQNSPFAAALLRQLEAPSVDLNTLAGKLRRDLLIATEGRQILWDINTYKQPFAIRGARGQAGANRSAWAGDPGKIIELPKAYAYAREIGVTLPEGLIAHRSAAGSPTGQMAGSFKYAGRYSGMPIPGILIVMAAEPGQPVELINAGTSEGGIFWRFITGTASGNTLEYQPREESPLMTFRWSDANSGRLVRLNDRGTGRGPGAPASTDTPFTRLDG